MRYPIDRMREHAAEAFRLCDLMVISLTDRINYADLRSETREALQKTHNDWHALKAAMEAPEPEPVYTVPPRFAFEDALSAALGSPAARALNRLYDGTLTGPLPAGGAFESVATRFDITPPTFEAVRAFLTP